VIDFMEQLFPRTEPSLAHGDSVDGGWSSAWTGLLSLMKSASGVVVTADTSMRQATVYACVRVLSETMAQFPRHVYRRLPGGMKTLATEHPLNYVFGTRPNRWQTPFEFVEMMQGHVCLRGNAYALIVPGELGSVTELWPLHPDRVEVERLEGGRLRYQVSYPSGRKEPYMQEEIFHLRGFSSDGLTGLSPIAYARDTIGLNLSAERYGAKFFRNAVRPSGFLKGPAAMRTKDAADAQRTLIEAYAGEDNHFKPMVLGGSLEWQNMGMNNDDAQFVETLTRGDKQIAKIFRMPPHKVGIMDDATFSNIEHQAREFVGDTMLPWVRRWEEAISRDLIVDNDVFYLRFEFEGLLRADTAARTAFYTAAINNGWMSPNEVRELEDMPPYKGGDEFFMQGAMVTVDAIINPPEPPAPMLPPPGPTPEQEAEREAEQQTAARRIGEELGRSDALRAEVAAKEAALAERNREAAEAKALLELKEAESARLSAELASAITAGAETVSQLAARTTACMQAEASATLANELAQAAKERQQQLETEVACLESLRAAVGVATQLNTEMLGVCLSRMLEIERDGIERASRKPQFLSAVEAFYDKHAERMKDALRPILEQRQSLTGKTHGADELADSYVADSTAALLVAAECQPEELAARVTDCLSQWEARSEAIISNLTEEAEDAGT
jgi:HK97 family phage portal protein